MIKNEQARPVPPGLTKSLTLLRRQPLKLRVEDGYLDLLGRTDAPRATGIQALWVSGIGSRAYDKAQAFGRRYFSKMRPQLDTLRITAGDRVLDVGCGPGDITAKVGQRVGPNGLAVGVDVSGPMLATAAARNVDNLAFVRADATDLPFDDGVFDAVNTVFVLQLLPDAERAFAEMVRVLRPGGRLCVVIPGDEHGSEAIHNRLFTMLGKVRMYAAAELAEMARANELAEIRGTSLGIAQVLSATKPA